MTQADIEIQALRSTLDRLLWLKGKIADEMDAMRDAAETLEIFTEDQAAMLLQVTPQLLASLRRRHNLPHVSIGAKVRYTKHHIAAVCDALTIGNKVAAMKKAA